MFSPRENADWITNSFPQPIFSFEPFEFCEKILFVPCFLPSSLVSASANAINLFLHHMRTHEGIQCFY